MVAGLRYLSLAIGLAGVAVIAWGVILMLVRLLRLEFALLSGKPIGQERETLRHQLGSYLLLGLEVLIAADIISTIAHPTLEDMAVLGSIVVIRTVISYFLTREMNHVAQGEEHKAET